MQLFKCKLCDKPIQRLHRHIRKAHPLEYEISTRKRIHYNNFYTVIDSLVSRPRTTEQGPGIFEKDCETYSFVWDDVQFKSKQLQIYIKRLDKRFIPIDCKSATESLNKIKEEFFRRFHGAKLYKLRAYDNKIMLNWSKDVNEIVNLIDAMVDFYNFRYDRALRIRRINDDSLALLTNEQIFRIFRIKPDKERFIRFLISRHDAKYKLIPLLESIGAAYEESFVFRVADDSGQQLVIWENLSPGRATYIFRIDEAVSKFNKILQYITEEGYAKRSFLRGQSNQGWARENLGFVCYLEHADFNTFQLKVNSLIHCAMGA